MPHVLIADGDTSSLQRVASLLEHARYQLAVPAMGAARCG